MSALVFPAVVCGHVLTAVPPPRVFVGTSEATINGPLKCFNPSKNWLLGWYNDKALEIASGESWTGRLVAFVDYDLANVANNEYVLLRLDDFLFVQFNRAKQFNAGTSLHADQVTLVVGVGGLSSSSSVLRAALGNLETYSYKGTTIEVCSLAIGSGPHDYAQLSVYPTGGTSTCNLPTMPPPVTPGPTTAQPTSTPTPKPSLAPTPMLGTRLPMTPSPTTAPPTPKPTPQPTPLPTLPPTPAITPRPTPQPTPLPTPSPTDAPTPLPSPNPTPNPTPQPTPLPTSSNASPPSELSEWVPLGNQILGQAENDESGFSVAMSSNGEIVAVGSWKSSAVAHWSGQVRVFAFINGAWTQRGNDINGEGPEHLFGTALAISSDGNVLAVGSKSPPFYDFDFSIDEEIPDPRGRLRCFAWDGSTWTAMGSPIDGEDAGDYFSLSVALSADGTVVAAGGPQRAQVTGYVRIFTWDGVEWAQRGQTLNGEEANDSFGYSVALSSDGSVVACGAPTSGSATGYARVYRWAGTSWQQVGSIISAQNPGGYFGDAISLSGDGSVVAIGADNHSYCAVFGFDGVGWVQIGDNIHGRGGDWFGYPLSLSARGDTLVIGGPVHHGNGEDTGFVRIVRLTADQVWVPLGQDLEGENAFNFFGFGVAISDDGNRIAVGGPGYNGGPDRYAGHVRIYDLLPPTPKWVQHGNQILGQAENDESGFSVAMSSNGEIVAVGSWKSSAVAHWSGQVRVFAFINGAWTQRGNDINGEGPEHLFGTALAISSDGNVLAVGSKSPPFYDFDFSIDEEIPDPRGRLRCFAWDGSTWTAMGSPIDGEDAGDYFSLSVALSADGTVVAAGGPQRAQVTGYVRIFTWDGVEWAQRGQTLNGEEANDSFGYSVALSSDGSVVACGAPTSGSATGYARVYRWAGTSWQQVGSIISAQNPGGYFGDAISLSGDGSVVAIGADNHSYCAVFGFDGVGWVQIGDNIHGRGGDWFGYPLSLSARGDTLVIGGPVHHGNGEDTGFVRIVRLTADQVWVPLGQDLEGENAFNFFGFGVAISDDGNRIAVGGPGYNGGPDRYAGHVRIYDLM